MARLCWPEGRLGPCLRRGDDLFREAYPAIASFDALTAIERGRARVPLCAVMLLPLLCAVAAAHMRTSAHASTCIDQEGDEADGELGRVIAEQRDRRPPPCEPAAAPAVPGQTDPATLASVVFASFDFTFFGVFFGFAFLTGKFSRKYF